MRCDDVRLALSARLDGEPELAPVARVDGHLAGCAGCRAWLAGAERVTRMVRVQPVRVPDLTVAILSAVHADGSLRDPSRDRRRLVDLRLRWSLAVLAVVQLMIAIPDLVGAAGHDAHAGRELAAFSIALAVGLLV